MKYLVYLLVCFTLISCQQENKTSEKADSNQTTEVTVPKPIAAKVTKPTSIAEIKTAFANTNSQLQEKQLDSIAYQYDCDKERAGTITYFSDKGKLVLIKHSYNEYDHYAANDYYFISNDSLYFANLNSVYWSFESGSAAEAATKDDVTEQRIYIVNGKAEQCLEKKYTIHSEQKNKKLAETAQNKQIECKPLKPLFTFFNKLVAFQKSSNKECLEK